MTSQLVSRLPSLMAIISNAHPCDEQNAAVRSNVSPTTSALLYTGITILYVGVALEGEEVVGARHAGATAALPSAGSKTESKSDIDN